MSSAVRFNPESGIRFCTYAKHRIRGMTRSLVESEGLERSRTLRLRPPSDRKGENKFDQDYIQIQGVWVGSEELPVSPALAAEDFHEELDKRAMFRDALALVDTLSEPERSMVRDYYLAGLSYRDLGQKYSLSHEMIRRRIGNAISKVKRGSTVHK